MSLDCSQSLEKVLCEPRKLRVRLHLFQCFQLFFKSLWVIDFLEVERVFTSSHKIVHNYSDGPDINTFRIFMLESNFRRHIHQSAHLFVENSLRKLISLAKTEINYLDRIKVVHFIYKYVGRFEIAMNYPSFMDVAHGLHDTAHNMSHIIIGYFDLVYIVLLNVLLQTTPFNQLHTHVKLSAQLN